MKPKVLNINRAFSFTKAIRDEGNLSGKEIYMLLCLVNMKDRKTAENIMIYLSKFGRSVSRRDCFDILKKLAELGYINKVAGVYDLTFSGSVVLSSLNERIKSVRVDKIKVSSRDKSRGKGLKMRREDF